MNSPEQLTPSTAEVIRRVCAGPATLILGKSVAAVCAAWFLAAPLYSFVLRGPFGWHVRQPAAYQGGAEVVVLIAIFYLAMSLRDLRLRISLAAAAALLYTRRHGIDLSVLLGYLYAEGIFAIGSVLLPLTGITLLPRPAVRLMAGLLGTVVWSLVIWICSAVGFGSLDVFRFIAISVLGIAILANRGPSLATLCFRSTLGTDGMGRLAIATLAAFFLALFAKASVVIDYDSLWYGLQAEEVLIGTGSLYASQGLVAVVHHYPKLFEALQLPFAGLGSVSLIYGVSIYSWVLVLLTITTILRELRVTQSASLWGAALVMTMPALANITVTAKGDAFSAWLLLMGLLGVIEYRKGRGDEWIWVVLSAALLGVQARLASIPYAAVLIGMLSYSVVTRWRRAGGVAALRNGGIWVAATTLLLTCFITARSILISGVALIAPHSLVTLQQAAGLTLRYPATSLPAGDGVPRLPFWGGLWGILFTPALYPHLVITWIGNVWLFIIVAVLLLGGVRAFRRPIPSDQSWPLLAMGMSFFAMMFGYRFLVPAGDGNYFIVPLASLTAWGVVQSTHLRPDAQRFLQFLLIPFVFCAAAVSFVTGSWGPGTRAIDRVMTRLPFEYTQRVDKELQNARMEGLASYFSVRSPATRVIGIEGPSGKLPNGWWLPVQYEVIEDFGWQKPEIFASAETFKQHLAKSGVEFVIVPTEIKTAIADMVRTSMVEMTSRKHAELGYQDERFLVWELRAQHYESTPLLGGGSASISFDPEQLCKQPVHGLVTVTWNNAVGNADGAVIIEVKATEHSTASVWADGSGSGTLTTGPWMPIGGEFIFKRGRGGEIIGTLKVIVNCD